MESRLLSSGLKSSLSGLNDLWMWKIKFHPFFYYDASPDNASIIAASSASVYSDDSPSDDSPSLESLDEHESELSLSLSPSVELSSDGDSSGVSISDPSGIRSSGFRSSSDDPAPSSSLQSSLTSWDYAFWGG